MLLSILQKLPWQRLIRFAITGGTAFAIDFAIYFVLTRVGDIHYLGARSISLGIAIIWNFTLNRHWTFEASAGKVSQQALRFLTVILTTSLLNLALMHIGVDYLRLNDLLVIVVVSLSIMLINFSAHYLWSYAQGKKTGEHKNISPIS